MKRLSLSGGSIALLSATLLFSPSSPAQMPRGSFGIDALTFPEEPLFPDQNDQTVQASVFGNIDWSADLTRDLRFDLNAFARVAPDAHDEVSGDLRQAVLRTRIKSVDIKAGVLQENWKVLEAWSPVDLVNQRDMVEDFQGKTKLGQPGLTATTYHNDLVLTALALPYTRERRIAEQENRLRTLPAPILGSTFEEGQSDPAYALRLQYRLGDLDLALSQFQGHTREPIYQPVIEQTSLIGFNELYEDVSQTNLEMQYVFGDSVFKAEAIYQRGGSDEFSGGGIGSETTFNQISNGFDSITFYTEAYYDGRSESAPITPFQRDLFFGLRYNANDVNDSLLEFRYTHDLEFHSDLIELRASRRLGNSQVISAQIVLPLSVESDSALQGFQDDRYFKLSWVWYL